MLRYCLLCISLCFVEAMHAQVTITRENFPDPGDEFAYERVLLSPQTVPKALFDTMTDNFILDLQYLDSAIVKQDTDVFKPTLEADGGRDIDDAEFAFKASFGHGFFRREKETLYMVGVSPDDPNLPIPIGFNFDKPLAHFITPLEAGDSYHDSSSARRFFGFIDVKVDVEVEYKAYNVGKIIILDGTEMEVLRMRRKYYFKVTASPISGPSTVHEDSLVTWEFYSKDIPNTILRADARIHGNDTTWYLDFFKEFITVGNRERAVMQDVEIQSRNGRLFVETPTASTYEITLYHLNGQALGSEQFTGKNGEMATPKVEPNLVLIVVYDTQSHEATMKKMVLY